MLIPIKGTFMYSISIVLLFTIKNGGWGQGTVFDGDNGLIKDTDLTQKNM